MTISTLDPWTGPAPEAPDPDDGVFVFPASYAQRRLWFLDRLAPGGAVYNLPLVWRLYGPLDSAALAASLGAVVERHESLRTAFAVEKGKPVQVVAPPGPSAFPGLPQVDLRELPPNRREGEAWRLVVEEAGRPFDLERGPLFRAALIQLAGDDHVLLATFHHIVADGWSLGVFQRELSALYRSRVTGSTDPLPDLPIQYADFAAWQLDWLEGDVLERHLAWWRARLAGAPHVLELPMARPRPAVSTQRGAWRAVEVPRGVSDALRAVGQSEGSTRFMTLLAVFKVLLNVYTGQEDLVVGTPISGRSQVETENLIGLFVNTLVLRTDLSGASNFRELLARVRETALGAYSHQELPFERLVEELQPERSLAHNPLVQVTFSLQERAGDQGLELSGLRARPLESGDRGEGTAKFDLALYVEESHRGLRARLDYDADLLDDVDALRLLESFQVLLAGIAADPWRPLWSLPTATEESRHQLLLEWNDTVALPPRDSCLHERFAAQAARTPETIALVYERESLTYAELDRRANRLSRRLISFGAGPEARVGIALERTPDLIVGLLAILKAGAAYVPLDPAYPRERLALILEDAAAPILLTSSSLLDRLPDFQGRLLCMDVEALDGGRETAPSPRATPGNLAYLIYTSGSTGRPKGVAIEHRSTTALLDWATEVFSPEEIAGILASTSVTFDLSVFEIFLPLTRGGTVLLADNALALPDLPAAGGAILVNTVPSAIGALLRTGGLPPVVRTVNLAGEPLKRSLVDAIYAIPTVERVWNLYGPSEDTTYSTFARVPRDEEREPTIGRPISHTRAYVLDHWLRPLPIGVPGELHLAGAGLARGYLNRPELTAASFIPDPFGGSGERLYRTGDLARRLADGRLEFLGRIDHQVKIRGFRIELGEIEAHLASHPAVSEAVVLAREQGSEKALTAYVVAREDLQPSGLRDYLREKLPAHMIPGGFVVLDALPLTPNGKVDRKALARLEPEREGEPAEAGSPRTAAEELLAGIWSEVLRREGIGIREDFFGLGGHSLLATQVVSRVREVFRVELPLRRFFETPT
ncbi:MAG TPA: amino acid adenylation domain-containing protein, partial [Thermoanaerobaculia bacterium]|nr:amino acid adenylation domain-containing protein [Thermoanaerobaculia bacterium]